MQTTLRIGDHIFREAKAEAAREGLTLTRFIEEALRLRTEHARHGKGRAETRLPVYDSKVKLKEGFDLPAAVRKAERDADHGRTERLFGRQER